MKHDILHELQVEAPNTDKHRNQLRQMLFSRSIQPTQSFVTRSLDRLLVFIKGVIEMKKPILKVTGLAVMAVAIGVATMFSPLNPRVAAQQITDGSIKVVSNMSAEELSAMRRNLATDPQALLLEASKAEDLKKLSRDEFNSLVNSSKSASTSYSDNQGNTYGKIELKSGSSVSVGSDGRVQDGVSLETPTNNSEDGSTSTSAGSNGSVDVDTKAIDDRIASAVEFVKYTNSQNQTVVVAFDGNNKPVYTTTIIN